MTDAELERAADAIAPRVAKHLAPALAEELYVRFQPHARALLETQRATAEMTGKTLGAMSVREEEGARRKQAMLDAAGALTSEIHAYASATDGKIAALAAEVRGVTTALALSHKPQPPPDPEPDEPPQHPKTTAAVDELGEEAATLLTAAIRGVKHAPARLYGWAEWVWTHPAEVQEALKRAGVAAAKIGWAWTRVLLLLSGAVGAARVLAPHIPGLEPVADFLQVLMDAASQFDTGAGAVSEEAPAEVAP